MVKTNYKRGTYKKVLKECEVEGCKNVKEMTKSGKYCSERCKQIAKRQRESDRELS